MAAINSADGAAAWAHRSLPAKNTLTVADAKIVEERFAARLCAIGRQEPDGPSNGPTAAGMPGGLTTARQFDAVADQSVIAARASTGGMSQKPSKGTKKQSRSDAVGALGKAVRLRDKDHRKFVLRQHALCAAGCRRIRITLRSHNPARLDAA